MGAVLSSEHLTAPVTLNRIRLACQKDSQLPYNIRKHHAQLLANDLNKIGFEIPIKTANGKEVPVEKLCERMTDVVPNVSSVCMINKSNRGNLGDAIKKMVDHFNKHYGSRIHMHKDPYGPKTKENLRPMEDICDDLYMVEDRIRRQLTDNTNFVKKNLTEHIALLEQYKTKIDEDFKNYLGNLQGHKMDDVRKKMHTTKALRESLVGELNKQLAKAKDGYKNIIAAYQHKIHPVLGTVEQNLDAFASLPWGSRMSGGGEDFLVGNKLHNLFVPALLIGQAAEACTDCMQKFNMNVDDFYNNDPNHLEHLIKNKYYDAILKASAHPNGQNEMNAIRKCRDALLFDKNYVNNCKLSVKGHSQFVQAQQELNIDGRCDLNTEDTCMKNNKCWWDRSDDSCKPADDDEHAKNLINSWLSGMKSPDKWGIADIQHERIKKLTGIPYLDGPGLHPVFNIFGGKSKRKSRRRKTAKRKTAKRKTRKRKTRKRKTAKRKTTKRK